jgi:hypothetical protein
MAPLDYRHGIQILELGVYLPFFFAALLLCFRHGFGRSSGWLFFAIFSLLRVVGACLSLATLNNNSTGLYVGWAICSSVGLSPLTLGLIGLLSRA